MLNHQLPFHYEYGAVLVNNRLWIYNHINKMLVDAQSQERSPGSSGHLYFRRIHGGITRRGLTIQGAGPWLQNALSRHAEFQLRREQHDHHHFIDLQNVCPWIERLNRAGNTTTARAISAA